MVKNLAQNQVERLLDLVPYLTTNPGVSLEKIASDFQTSKASVVDDLNTLWMCGLPGYTPLELIDLSFETGFVSIRNADVLSKPRKLSSSEIGAVIVGLSILRESISVGTLHYEGVSGLITRMSSTSHVPAPMSIVSDVQPEVRLLIEQCIRDEKNLSIAYHSFAKDVQTTREIIPLNVQVIDKHEYLESYCLESSDFRVFRLDRIEKAELAGSSDKVSVRENSSSQLREFRFKVSFDFRRVSETFHIHIPSGLSTDNEFVSTAYNDEWVIRTICSLNSAAILNSPADVREEIATRAKKALKLYK